MTRGLGLLDLGVYAQGEIPLPFTHIYKNSRGQRVDLTDWTSLGFKTVGTVLTGVVTISDATSGEVTYTWVENDTALTGSFMGRIWVESEDASVRLSSWPIRWRVEEGLLLEDAGS